NEIKDHIRAVGRDSDASVVIVEVGGTVGDIEGQPFLEAVRQMRKEEGREDILAIHVTLLPYISTTGELKTKPTQHSVRELRSMGIQPDVIICRSDYQMTDDLREKISLFCDVEKRAVVPLPTMATIYEVPLVLEQAGLAAYIMERLHVPGVSHDLDDWQRWVARLKSPRGRVSVAVVGKYAELPDAYLSVKEALIHAAVHYGLGVDIRWVHSGKLEESGGEAALEGVHGIVVPGGFGERAIEGMVRAARYARQEGVPYLGLCLGMQIMVIEFARQVFQSDAPHSTEFCPSTPYPVISLLSEQEGIEDKGGTMRLGGYPCHLTAGTKTYAAYGEPEVVERHRHRYEFNNAYREALAEAGLIASGLSPDGALVEICEVRDHPWMVGSQFHAEFRSRPNRPHPLFRGFMEAAARRAGQLPAPAAAVEEASPRP
ncbi:MAG: CTP synthase, partial [Dehalococcoidia bacterium]